MPRKYPRAPEADEVPEPDLPPYDAMPEQETALRNDVRAAIAKRQWAPGRTYRCPSCQAKALKGTNQLNLQAQRDGMLIVYPALRGAECGNCHVKVVEPNEMALLEQGPLGSQWMPQFDLKVSSIGRGSLGTYWTKEIERNLHLHKDTKLRAQLLNAKQVLITVE